MSFLNVMRDVLQHAGSGSGETVQTRPWLSIWRELAILTNGIAFNDSQSVLITKALDNCDNAYLANDWSAFQQASLMVRQLVKERSL